MRPEGPTFWLLNGQTNWGQQERGDNFRLAQKEAVSAGSVSGLRLAGVAKGPFALDAADDSLGGLVLPRGLAFDHENLLYLLSQKKPILKRFDPATQTFQIVEGIGGQEDENLPDARQFDEPTNIAVAGRNLYITNQGNCRVQAFILPSLALRHLWEFEDWKPIDVAAQEDDAFILDSKYGRVYHHQVGIDQLTPIIDKATEQAKGNIRPETIWTRIIVDRDKQIYLLGRPEITIDPVARHLDVFQPAAEAGTGNPCTDSPVCISGRQWQFKRSVEDAGDVRDNFDPPALRLFLNCFCLPESLARPAGRQMPALPPPPEMPFAQCPPASEGGYVFDREGNRRAFNPAGSPGPRIYSRCGTWISPILDSQIYDCQWHRIELKITALPPGTKVAVSTYTSGISRRNFEIEGLPDHLWETKYQATGAMQPNEADTATENQNHEFLIQSREGQFLWIKVELAGDGYATPVVESLKVHYPRQSYLEYLPAVYGADDESRRFMEQFLSLFQTDWDDLEQQLETMARFFDPNAVPEGPFMSYLAQWLALPLEGDWSGEQKRRLLSAAPKIYPKRGTSTSLRQFLRVYLSNIIGLETDELRDYPHLIEGFRVRQHLMLSTGEGARIGQGPPLWGPGKVGRLQLDVFSRLDEVRLVSTGDPERDLFHEYAHQFRVFIPSTWVKSKNDELMLRRALDAEKPAHTQYDFCLVAPRFRVGVQSTVGLDTIIGPYPVAQLAHPDEADPNKTTLPPSRPPQHRLGYDTILAGDPVAEAGLILNPGARIGLDTALS